jgi:hypothetical protein
MDKLIKGRGKTVKVKPEFTKRVIGVVINATPPGPMNTFSTVGDINRDGLPDIVVSGRNGKMVWLENPGTDGEWKQHLIDNVEKMECGGSLHDLTANGYLDVINGGDSRLDEIYWWENPGPRETGKWKRRMIAKTSSTQFHDTVIGDITGEGTISLVFDNQIAPGGTTLYRVPLPKDPRLSPWPGLEVIASGKCEPNPHHPYREDGIQPEEGLAIGDLDGDGKNELVCGTHWYKYTGHKDQPWEAHKFAAGYLTTKIAIGDIDGDGTNEIILSEGDPCVYGKTQGGKLSWFKPQENITGMWEEHVLEDRLLDAHSLQLGDICGNGRLDILVGEVGMADRDTDRYIVRPPRLIVFENSGRSNFTRHVIDEGTGIHEALLVDMLDRGVLDIAGKPLHGPEKWNVHVWYNQAIPTKPIWERSHE